MRILLFYQCRWCGKVFPRRASYESTINPMGELMMITASQDPRAQLSYHTCDAERTGVADLVGAREAKDGE